MRRAVLVAAVLLAGCGGAAPRPRVTTVPAYAGFPPDTITVTDTDPRSPACRVDATSFAASSLRFVTQHPADTYYMVMREELADFGVRRCDPALLGRALRRTLTARQRDALVADLPRPLADVVRRGLDASAS